MSAVIGICCPDFCLFVADRRKVTICNYEIRFNDDNTEKIIKLNEQIIFGATGIFEANERIDQPFLNWSSVSSFDFDLVCEIVKDYCRMNLSRIKTHGQRAYLIGGKSRAGIFKICHIHFDALKGQFITEIYDSSKSLFCYCMALPPKALHNQYEYLSSLTKLIQDTSNKHGSTDDLANGMMAIISSIADIDETVGKSFTVLQIV